MSVEHKEITSLHIGFIFLVIFSSDCSGSLKFALHSFFGTNFANVYSSCRYDSVRVGIDVASDTLICPR